MMTLPIGLPTQSKNFRKFLGVYFLLSAGMLIFARPAAAQFAPKGLMKEQPKASEPTAAPEPATAKKKAASPKALKKPTSATSSSSETLDEILATQQAILSKLNALSPAEAAEAAPTLSPTQQKQKASLLAELEKLQTQRASIETARNNGVDPSIFEEPSRSIEMRIAEVEREIGAIQPEAPEKTASPETASTNEILEAVRVLENKVDAMEPPSIEPPVSSPAAQDETETSYGFSLELGLASHYVFRGLNLFMADSQQDAHALFAPAVSWAIFDSGISIGYWSAYQITGGNQDEMVASGLGHEQDLIAGYERDLSDTVGFSAGLVYYFYPFADEADAGAANPSYLEPSLGISYSGPMDIEFGLSYFAGLQAPLHDLSYLYLNPTIGKGFEIRDNLETSLSLGFGYKLFTAAPAVISDNMFDVAFDWYFSVAVTDKFSINPGIHAAWTNLQDKVVEGPNPGDPSVTDPKRIGDEYIIFFTLTSALDI